MGELAMSGKAHIHQTSVGKSGGGALKAVELTTGILLHVVDIRLGRKRFFLSCSRSQQRA